MKKLVLICVILLAACASQPEPDKLQLTIINNTKQMKKADMTVNVIAEQESEVGKFLVEEFEQILKESGWTVKKNGAKNTAFVGMNYERWQTQEQVPVYEYVPVYHHGKHHYGHHYGPTYEHRITRYETVIVNHVKACFDFDMKSKPKKGEAEEVLYMSSMCTRTEIGEDLLAKYARETFKTYVDFDRISRTMKCQLEGGNIPHCW